MMREINNVTKYKVISITLKLYKEDYKTDAYSLAFISLRLQSKDSKGKLPKPLSHVKYFKCENGFPYIFVTKEINVSNLAYVFTLFHFNIEKVHVVPLFK